MSQALEQLQQAHTRFIVDKLKASEREYAKHFAERVDAWAEKQSLDTLLNPGAFNDIVDHVVSLEPNPELAGKIATMLISALQLSALSRPLGEVADKEQSQKMLEQVLELEDAREHLIHGFINSQIFSQILTDILYNGIKSYLSDDGGIAGKIPGMNSMLKMGKWASTKASPNLEQSIDKTIKSFLGDNISNSVRFTEKLINDMLKPSAVGKIFSQVWEQIETRSLDEITQHIKQKDADKIAAAMLDIWNDLRQNQVIINLLKQSTLEMQSKLEGSVKELASAANIDQAWLASLAEKSLIAITSNDAAMSEIEAFLAQELASFYQSDAAKNIINDKEPA